MMLSEHSMKVSIREFVEQDRELCKQVLAELRDWFGIKSSNKTYISILGTIPTAVAVVDDEIIGFAALEQHNQDSIELHVIAVKKAYHNRGIGTKLINWAELGTGFDLAFLSAIIHANSFDQNQELVNAVK
ncbi:MAG: GNAT family N-acetyltransferase [Desulfobacteraceae bacterium]|nr:GNAT family N-acetyltransferase [Desulfobacteraceae bacterium]MBU4002557.1 GNAT family N-acetyltransferase [Pseudomonadota bacterium]